MYFKIRIKKIEALPPLIGIASLMGAATSSPFPLSESFIPFTSWSTVQMNDLLLRYNEMDLDFGINMSEFMTLFDVDEAVASGIMRSDLVSALNLICALTLCSEGTLDDKLKVLFRCFDFDETNAISADELVILFVSTAHGLVEVAEGAGVPLSDAEMDRHAVACFLHAGIDRHAPDATIKLGDFLQWAKVFSEETELSNVGAIVAHFCPTSGGGDAAGAEAQGGDRE